MFRSITSRSLQSFRKFNKRSPGGFTLFGCPTIKIPKNTATVFEYTSQKTRSSNLDHWKTQPKRHFFSSQFPKILDAEKGYSNNSNNLTSVSYENKKVEDWNVDNVAEWARDELKFNNESVDILKKRQIRGTSLFTFDNKQELVSMGLEVGPAGELWVAIQNLKTKQAVDPSILVAEWQRLSSQYPTDLVSAFGSKMPVVQRSKEISMAWNALKMHYHGWKTHQVERKEHPRCFAYGPPGSGKTKFGVELIQLLKSYGQQLAENNKSTNEDKEILKLLSNSIFIHITFANGNGLLEDEHIETALVVRGIRSLFGLNEMKISMFYSQFGDKIKNWNLDTLMSIAKQHDTKPNGDPRMIYIHLDEFNHLHNKDPKIFKQVVDLLSTSLCTPLPEVFYNVLFTGTAYTEMKKLGVSESYPLTELPMQILDTKGIMEVVSIMHRNGHLPWIDDSWKENKPFILSLINTGGLPRALEYFLEEMEARAKAFIYNLSQMTIQDIEAASNSAETRLLTRYHAAFVKSTAVYTEALALGILGESIVLNDRLQLEKDETYASLLSTGSILLKSINQERWIIQLPIIWLNKYIQKLNLTSVMSKDIYEELTSIKPGTWSQWERMTANMLMLRTNAIKLLRRNEFKFSDIFPGANGSNEIMDQIFETHSNYYKRQDYAKQFLKNPKNTLQEDKAGHLFVPGTVWLNGLRGPAFDLWTVYKNKKDPYWQTKSFTITFVQCKFSSTNEPLRTTDIIKEYNQLEEMWKNTLIELKDSPIKGSNIQPVDFDVVFVVVSNRTLQENHAIDDHSNGKALSKCIICDMSSVSSFFSTFNSQLVQSLKN